MADHTRIGELVQKCQSFREHIVSFRKFANEFDADNASHYMQIQIRLQDLIAKFPELTEWYNELSVLNPENNYANEKEEIENAYYDSVARAQGLITPDISQSQIDDNQRSFSNGVNGNGSAASSCRTKIKLPQIVLPSFSGDTEDWLAFKGNFNSIIGNREDLTDGDKLSYLQSTLKSCKQAYNKIKKLNATAEDYRKAWKLLKRSYEDKRETITSHMRSLLNLPSQKEKETSSGLIEIADEAPQHMEALLSLGIAIPEEVIVAIIENKLNKNTTDVWELNLKRNEFPKLDELTEFMYRRAARISKRKHESSEPSEKSSSRGPPPKKRKFDAQSFVTDAPVFKTCPVCPADHPIYKCKKFRTLSIDERFAAAKAAKLCYNCLKRHPGFAKDCKAGTCKICPKKGTDSENKEINNKHNTLLHRPANAEVTLLPTFQLMTTALINAYDVNNRQIQARTLLDTCATANFITSDLAHKLKLPQKPCCVSIGAVNNLSTAVKFMTNVTFKSRYNNFKRTLCFLIVPSISESVPSHSIPREKLKIPHNIHLADPDFDKPAPVDMLIGAGTTLSMFCIGSINLSEKNHDLILQKTQLGWVLGGGLSFSKNTNHESTTDCMLSDLKETIEKFWLVEELPNKSQFTQEELDCEEHFKKFVSRAADGRYIVALPFNESPRLVGESKEKAYRRFLQLLKRFLSDDELKEEYSSSMNKLIESGHMSLSDGHDSFEVFLPHHPVIKASSITTKLRVVFDASAEGTGGRSLNGVLMNGGTIQDTLFALLLRFRMYLYVLMADIEKMFLQFLVREEDRKYLKTFWLKDGKIVPYQLNTVTFGLKSAPFLAVRCLHQLAEDEGARYPLAAKILTKDVYVDNLITGTNSRDEAREIYEQMTKLLKLAQLNMRQWVSNVETILEGVDEKSLDNSFLIDKDSALKALGMYWKAKQDCFIYKIHRPITIIRVTKRLILSEIARLFDPLGLLGPVILYAKCIVQDLWQLKIDWDESVPTYIYCNWKKFSDQLKCLKEISFSRHALIKKAKTIQLHGFSDASERGYGACIYIVSSDANNKFQCSLLCAKSRVAPLKKLTVPRLELSGALLLAELYEAVIKSINLQFDSTIFWTDSEIVLHWLHTPASLLKTYVANRVSQIQEKTEIKDWRHVRTFHNPADKLSRGQLPYAFIKNDMWFDGPEWLSKNETNWPKCEFKLKQRVLPETKKITCLKLSINFDPLKRFSDFQKTKRMVARWIRVAKKTKQSTEQKLKISDIISICKNITVKELNHAEELIIKLVQRAKFAHEIRSLSKNKPLDKESSIYKLDPFLDGSGLIRVGGRLENSTLSYNRKHPIILPKNHFVTDMIIDFYHHGHTGVQTTLYSLRQKYWLIDGRNEVRKFIRQCIKCFRASPKLSEYKMGNLPEVRTNLTRAFLNVGVDYCGPFYIKERRRKSRLQNKIKMYVAVFVCMASKAIHIEVVDDLTTEAFLGALRRFITRRGKPQKIYADNATNFKGARNELHELYALVQSKNLQEKVDHFTSNNAIEFHFIPPSSPHFGGLWEAGVKSYKHHYKRVASNHVLTFIEFYTLSLEIEAILNSRPLTAIPTDANDLSALTPGHFLIGDSLIALPEPDFLPLPSNRLSAWQLITRIRQDFWKRWHLEYLNELNVRQKWNVDTKNPKEGAIVVLKEDNTPTMQWPLARILQLHHGKDNIVRTVTLKTVNGVVKRPVTKIAVLPITTVQ